MKVGGLIDAIVAEEVAASAVILPDGRKGMALSVRSGGRDYSFVFAVGGVEVLCEVIQNAVADVCAINREEQRARAVRS